MESDFLTGSRRPRRLPPEIVEMIIAHLKYDTPTLKACATTCSTWYHIATPHLHHTLTFWEYFTRPEWAFRNPLPSLHKLGLLPFVKRVEFKIAHYGGCWDTPAFFDSRSMRHFGALVNIQSLAIADLHFSESSAWTGKHFGHLSLTLRSLALSYPDATRRQLLDFFRLFPRLDDLKILGYSRGGRAHEALDTQLVPIKGGLRGQLSLRSFGDAWLLKDMIVAFGGMRFTSMKLQDVEDIPLLLEACADTLETVYMRPSSSLACKRVERVLPMHELTPLYQHVSNASAYQATTPFDLSKSQLHSHIHITQKTSTQSKNSFPLSHLQCFPRSSSYSQRAMWIGHQKNWLRCYARCTRLRSLGRCFVWRRRGGSRSGIYSG